MGRGAQQSISTKRFKRGLSSVFDWLGHWRNESSPPGILQFSRVKPRPSPGLEVQALLRCLAQGQAVPTATAWSTLTEALELAVSENAYDTASALVDDALPRLEGCPKSSRKRVLRRIVDNLAARGEQQRIVELISSYHRELPKTGYAPEFFGDHGGLPPVNFDDYHAIYRALREGQLTPAQVLARFDAERSLVGKAPQVSLLLFYALRRLGHRGSAVTALSRYLRAEGLAPLSFSGAAFGNVLEALQGQRSWFRRRSRHCDESPLVSVVCSAYRAESTLGYAVRSLLAQTHEHLEVLLCDDGSDDATFALAQQLAQSDRRVRLFRSKGNQGTYNVRNALIPLCRGRYVTFHDGDDYALPSRFETQLLALKETNARACVANWLRILPDGLVVFFRDGKEKRLSIVSLMVERELMLKLLPYRSARHSADLEMYERLLAEVGPCAVARVTAPLLFGLWSSQSLTRGQGSEALENGYRAPSRRRYAELCFRQRLLGMDALPNQAIDDELRAMGNYFEPRGVEAVT